MKVLALIALSACAGGLDSGTPGVDAPTSGDGGTCVLGVNVTPDEPIAGVDTMVAATALINGATGGQHTYQWVVLRGGQLQTPPSGSTTSSMIQFPVNAAVYTVAFSIEDPACLQASEVFEVNPPGTMTSAMRVHVISPDPDRPPLVKSVLVDDDTEDVQDPIQLPEAMTVNGSLQGPNGPVQGYLKFMPTIGKEAIVEAYADSLGNFEARVRPETHDVLVVPSNPAIPPQIVTWQQQTTLTLVAGTQVSGTVTAGGPLSNAQVQVTIDGVPSTIGTTNGAGVFNLLLVPKPGALVRIEVTPAPASGLARLVAESTTFDPTQGITVSYTFTATRDLVNTLVQRGAGNPLGNADVSIVGNIGNAGEIDTGGGIVDANGSVRVSATTNGTGQVSLRAPATQLSAVVFPGAVGDHSITPIDLTSAAPGTINAVATVARPTQLRSSTNVVLPGAVLDAVPVGDLALAGAPTIRQTADAGADLSVNLAPNGSYQVRLSDPNGNRAAQRIVSGVTSANLAATLQLSKATLVQGRIDGASPISGAIVQFLCAACTGLERSRPIAEGITGIDGRYSLAVPDPN